MILAMAFAHLWGVLELVAVASVTRTIRVRTALAALAAGLYTCSLTAILLQTTWTRLGSRLVNKYLFQIVPIASYTLDPFIEEFVKVLPLVILIWMIPSVRRQWSTADCILIGAASGAGFGLAENLFRFSGALNRAFSVNGGWEVVHVLSVWQPTVPSFITSLTSWLPAGVAGGNPFSQALSPDHFNLHLEWSALAGLAVALIFLIRSNVSRTAGIILWLYVGADHTASNLTLSGQPGTLCVLAAPFNALRSFLCLMPAAALVAAWWLDRSRQRGSRAPELTLASERQGATRILNILRSIFGRPPRSILLVESLTRLRRAYAAHESSQPDGARRLRQEIIVLRGRLVRLLAGAEAATVVSVRGIARSVYSIIRQPKVLVWVALMLPSAAWLVIGGFPQTVWLQSVLKSPTGWIVVRVCSVLGFIWLGTQLVFCVRRWSRLISAPLGELAATSTLRLASGTGAFLVGIYTIVLATMRGTPDSQVLSNFHVLEAVESARLIGTQLTALAAVALFPPIVNLRGPNAKDLVDVLNKTAQQLNAEHTVDPEVQSLNCSSFFKKFASVLADTNPDWNQAIQQTPGWSDPDANANAIAQSIRADSATSNGQWKPVSQADAQQLANEGAVVVGVAPAEGHGHVAIVSPVPSDIDLSSFGVEGPMVRDGNVHQISDTMYPSDWGTVRATKAFYYTASPPSWYVWKPSLDSLILQFLSTGASTIPGGN